MNSVAKIAIIQFPGSNCERESALAIKRAGMEPVEFLWNEPVEKLHECDGYFIIGGFSYEDRSRAGIIASLDPVMKIISEESEKGKPVLGICNGAQILVETGLVPGLQNNRVGMALSGNRMVKDGHVMGTGYYNVWANVKLTHTGNRCAFTRHFQEGERMNIPIAHAEGRFMMDDDLLEKLQANDQAVFKYCNENGEVIPDFPVNPNGSMDNLAAVCNTEGNVMAMMPHPERTIAGDPIFTSMRDYLNEDTQLTATTLDYEPCHSELETYRCPDNSEELLVDLIITDNEAVTVENALRHLGIAVSITRQSHWEIALKTDARGETVDKIVASGEVLNSNKESPADKTSNNGEAILVRYKDDLVGQHKKAALKEWFHIEGIQEIRSGVIWHITPDDEGADETLEKVLQSHILFNPYSHNGYKYE